MVSNIQRSHNGQTLFTGVEVLDARVAETRVTINAHDGVIEINTMAGSPVGVGGGFPPKHGTIFSMKLTTRAPETVASLHLMVPQWRLLPSFAAHSGVNGTSRNSRCGEFGGLTISKDSHDACVSAAGSGVRLVDDIFVEFFGYVLEGFDAEVFV